MVLKEYIYHALYTAICELMEVCKEESSKLQIQKSRLGLALAFLRLKQVKIEQLFEGMDWFCPAESGDIGFIYKYNKEEVAKAKKEHRKADLLPRISAHNLRHTACTNMAKQGMNVKVLQYIMGHAGHPCK